MEGSKAARIALLPNNQAQSATVSGPFQPTRRGMEAPKEDLMMLELSALMNMVAAKIEELAEKQKAALALGEQETSPWTHEAVMLLFRMIASDSEAIRKRGAAALGKLASCSPKAKHEATNHIPFGILMELMRAGCLEAIDALAALSFENSLGCDKIRECLPDCGAITMLAGFINTEDNAVDAAAKAASSEAAMRVKAALEPEGSIKKKKAAQEINPANLRDLSELGSTLLPGMSAAKDAVGMVVLRPTIVPVKSKAEAVTTLRNIAMSNEANRKAITQQQVIPQLVKLMTQMKIEDDNRSAQSGQSSHRSGPSDEGKGDGKDSRRSRRKSGDAASAEKKSIDEDAKKEQVLNRKALALENRKLAESAGQMLHALIIDGTDDVKKIIISAIISTVQQPGSKPPKEVPQLMNILKSAAEEQLEMVQRGDDYVALNMALDFGRWIGLRTIKLGEARNNFKLHQDDRKKEEKERARRLDLGLADSDEQSSKEQDTPASKGQRMQLIEDSDRETPSKNSATAKEAEKQSRQSKRDAKKEAEAKRVANRETMVREKKQQAVVASVTQSGKGNTRLDALTVLAKPIQLEAKMEMKRLQATKDSAEPSPISPSSSSWHLKWLPKQEPGLPADLFERTSGLPKGLSAKPVDAELHFQMHEMYRARRQAEDEQARRLRFLTPSTASRDFSAHSSAQALSSP